VRAAVMGDSPLARRPNSSRDRTRARNLAWRDLAGGKLSIAEIAEALKDAPTKIPGQDESVTMREKHGEDSIVYEWVATNLYHTDPDFFTALLDGTIRVGYETEKVLPAICCPVLLLQADPSAGGVMTDVEVSRAMALLAQPQHARLAHIGQSCTKQRRPGTPIPGRLARLRRGSRFYGTTFGVLLLYAYPTHCLRCPHPGPPAELDRKAFSYAERAVG
jgi:hypothetical protein